MRVIVLKFFYKNNENEKEVRLIYLFGLVFIWKYLEVINTIVDCGGFSKGYYILVLFM